MSLDVVNLMVINDDDDDNHVYVVHRKLIDIDDDDDMFICFYKVGRHQAQEKPAEKGFWKGPLLICE